MARSPASDLPEARGGLAYGSLLLRGGDYFGPAVNLASRLVDLAEPGSVIADRCLGEALDGDGPIAIEALGAERVRGIGEVQLRRLIRCHNSLE